MVQNSLFFAFPSSAFFLGQHIQFHKVGLLLQGKEKENINVPVLDLYLERPIVSLFFENARIATITN